MGFLWLVMQWGSVSGCVVCVTLVSVLQSPRRCIQIAGVVGTVQRCCMYACPHCDSTKMFMAFRDGMLLKVLEDHEDVEGLDEVGELLCVSCNQWFPNPTLGEGAHKRVLTGELVTMTGLRGKGTIKVVATGIKFPFHYDTYEDDAVEQLRGLDRERVLDILEFVRHGDHTLALRVKEDGNPNTWVYRLDRRHLTRGVER